MGTVSKICHQNKMRWIFLSVALVCVSAIEQEGSDGTEVMGKKPELFSVFTSYTTTTISTETVCYFTTVAAPYPCYRRKKRAFSSEALDQVPQFQSSQVESGMDATALEERPGKFLQYWLTTTFTKTWTVGSVVCTPPGAILC